MALPLLLSAVMAAQDNTNKRDQFDSKIYTLANSAFTGRDPGNFTAQLNNQSMGMVGKGLTGTLQDARSNAVQPEMIKTQKFADSYKTPDSEINGNQIGGLNKSQLTSFQVDPMKLRGY